MQRTSFLRGFVRVRNTVKSNVDPIREIYSYARSCWRTGSKGSLISGIHKSEVGHIRDENVYKRQMGYGKTAFGQEL